MLTCAEAEAAIERLAAAPVVDGLVIREIWLLDYAPCWRVPRAMRSPTATMRDRYRAMATSLGFEGHMKWAEAMP